MSLTDDDLDRLGDKLKIAVHEAMDAHKKEVHEPLEIRLNDMSSDLKIYKGIGIGLMAVVSVIEAIGGFLRHGGGTPGAHP